MSERTSWASRTTLTVGGIALAIVFFLAVNVFSNAVFRTAQIDLTEEKLFTVTEATTNLLSSLDEPIRLRFYISDLVRDNIPTLANYAARVEEMLQQYEQLSGGNIQVEVFHPEQFSPEEDQAVGYGIIGIPASAVGDVIYFGVAGTNSTDDEDIIPFFSPARESFLEYDLSKLVFNLSRPKKTLVAMMSSLPVNADPRTRYRAWISFEQAAQFFDFRILGGEIEEIDEAVDILLLVQPTGMVDKTLYAIDQYFMRGGKGLIFVDPHAEMAPRPRNPNQTYVAPSDHSLGPLFEAWGIEAPVDQVVGDRLQAQRVTARSGGRGVVTDYLPWMTLGPQSIERDDVVTSEIERISILSGGRLGVTVESGLAMKPLLFTSPQSTLIDRKDVRPAPDPLGIVNNFVSDDTSYPVAARFSGIVGTAFPDGRPIEINPRGEVVERPDPEGDAVRHLSLSVEPINIIVVADADMLSDPAWLRGQGGTATPVAQNGDFFINALDNLAGTSDLISLRGRGLSARPFVTVNDIRRDAETQFRSKEQELVEALQQTERKIAELQREDQGTALLSREQRDAIIGFRSDQLRNRADLREVQHALVQDIDRLDRVLKLLNIGAIPVLIGVFAIGLALFRRFRFSRKIRGYTA